MTPGEPCPLCTRPVARHCLAEQCGWWECPPCDTYGNHHCYYQRTVPPTKRHR